MDQHHFPDPADVRRDRLRLTIEAALPAALERAQLVSQMRQALEQGDDHAALTLARQLCGLSTLKMAS